MPISVIVGGQFGSEGKGKAALETARRAGCDVVAVRVGGPNSGHTAYDLTGRKRVFRQIPVAAVDGAGLVVLPAGSYLDVPLLLAEIADVGLEPGRLVIDPAARIVTDAHRAWECGAGIVAGIGSTGSGTGAAVIAASAREAAGFGIASPRASSVDALRPFIGNAAEAFRQRLDRGHRIVLEGTQGFGLSVLHGEWPHVTSRDTTAAGFLAEAGLSPLDVDEVTLVIRCHPIRVAGASGPLPGETDWETIGREAGADRDISELTTVTRRIRRVGRFASDLVRRAIMINRPSRIVLNHLDYVDWRVRDGILTPEAEAFVRNLEAAIGAAVDAVGVNERDEIAMPRPVVRRLFA